MNSKGRLLLLHWHAEECRQLAEDLQGSGWDVIAVSSADDIKARELRESPPAALLISLRRLPSHGREVASWLSSTKWGRTIPIVFMDGAPDKVEAARQQLPHARYTTEADVSDCLEELRQSARSQQDEA